MITFYGSPMSCSERCHWMLEEVGVPYDYKIINTREGQTKTPEFLAVNPTGKIPAIADGDLKLAESLAINMYLAEKYAPSMMPSDYAHRAKIYEWSFWAATNLQPLMVDILLNTMFFPEDQRNPKVVERAKAEAPRYLEVLDKALAGRDFLVGDHFTVADANVASIVLLAGMASLELGQHTKAWMARMQARPAYKRALGG